MSLIPARSIVALRRRYAEPHRTYHGQSHVDAMLQATQARSRDITDPDAVELATWYQDAIYDPAATDNEARSADLLVAEMAGSQSPSSLRTAELMVRATAEHTMPAGLPDAVAGDVSIFLDLDMGILGADPAEYDAYEAGIAAEYVPIHGAEAYRSGRTAFLRMMLARDRLFHTDASHAAMDTPARANMRRALAGLEGPSRRMDGTATNDEPVETRDGPAMRPPAAVRIDEVARINREGWDRRVDDHDVWTLPVSPQDIGRARLGDWFVLLTPNKPVPRDWFGEVAGKDILCLASGGGQQGPILAAAGGPPWTSRSIAPRCLRICRAVRRLSRFPAMRARNAAARCTMPV